MKLALVSCIKDIVGFALPSKTTWQLVRHYNVNVLMKTNISTELKALSQNHSFLYFSEDTNDFIQRFFSLMVLEKIYNTANIRFIKTSHIWYQSILSFLTATEIGPSTSNKKKTEEISRSHHTSTTFRHKSHLIVWKWKSLLNLLYIESLWLERNPITLAILTRGRQNWIKVIILSGCDDNK